MESFLIRRVEEHEEDGYGRAALPADKRAGLDLVALKKHRSGIFALQRIVEIADSEPSPLAKDLATEIEALCERGLEDEAADRLLDALEAYLRGNDFAAANAILLALKPQRLPVSVTLVALTITWYGREGLAARPSFVARADTALRAKVGVTRAEALLADRR